MEGGQYQFSNSLGLPSNWEWQNDSDDEQTPKTARGDAGNGWSAEGSNDYKWNQYESPPVQFKVKQENADANQESVVKLDMSAFQFDLERTPREQSDHIMVLNLPFIGRLNIVKSRNGILQASFVLFYWIYGSWSLFTLVLLPHYQEGNIGFFPLFWYGLVSLLCIMAFTKAVFVNPGRIPLSDTIVPPPVLGKGEKKPDDYCNRCQQNRPSTAHHCSTCGQCVRRMDHHCPWINNCVGEDNRFIFVQLVMYAGAMSSSALLFLLFNAYLWPQCELCRTPMTLGMTYRYDLLLVCFILSALMMCLGGGLYLTQMCLVRHDMTTLDFYKYEDVIRMSGKSPWEQRPLPKRPCGEAFTDLCGRVPFICYFYPCRTRIPPVFMAHKCENMSRV